MTVRAKYLVNGITDRGAGQPKTATASWIADDAIPAESRLLKAAGWNSISLNIDNQALLAQVGVGKVLVVDISVQDGAPAIAPAPAPVQAQLIAVNDWPTTILQAGDYWVFADEWGVTGLTRGTYTDINGTTFEHKIGISQQLGPNGELSWRTAGKFPTGSTEVKAYPSAIVGNKPGWSNTYIVPGGYQVQLPDGSISQTYPSGPTPHSFFPLALPLTSLKATLAYEHNATPTGRGQVTFDIWLQNSPTQGSGFAAPPVTTEIMIPLDYWGGYGAYVPGGGGRNPGWYWGDDTIDGNLWHIFQTVTATNKAGGVKDAYFNGQWNLIVFEPNAPGLQPGTVDVAAFINYAVNKGWTAAIGGGSATHCVDVQLGIEPVDGTYDTSFSNFRVYQ